MKIKIFGKLTDIFQVQEYVLVEPVSPVSELRKKLETLFPDLKTLNYLVVIDNENAGESDNIPKEAEIALLPPYSGG